MSDPPPDICSTCGECVIKFISILGSLKLFISVEGPLEFKIFYVSVAQIKVLFTRIAKYIFNLPLCASREHCALPLLYRYEPLFWYHHFGPKILSPLFAVQHARCRNICIYTCNSWRSHSDMRIGRGRKDQGTAEKVQTRQNDPKNSNEAKRKNDPNILLCQG